VRCAGEIILTKGARASQIFSLCTSGSLLPIPEWPSTSCRAYRAALRRGWKESPGGRRGYRAANHQAGRPALSARRRAAQWSNGPPQPLRGRDGNIPMITQLEFARAGYHHQMRGDLRRHPRKSQARKVPLARAGRVAPTAKVLGARLPAFVTPRKSVRSEISARPPSSPEHHPRRVEADAQRRHF